MILRIAFILCLTGCAAPRARLTFPTVPLKQSGNLIWYATHGDGRPDFALSLDPQGNVAAVCYSDHRDGSVDRVYRLADYADRDVPHAIILLDSIPYQSMADAYAAGRFRWFHSPQKVIAPFPSLTEICYSDVLHAPPLAGMIDQSYDPRRNAKRSAFWERVKGYTQPWEHRLDYHATFFEFGLSFLDPRPWYAAELERCRAAIDATDKQTTIVYAGSAASLVCKYGRPGVAETLHGAERLCLQLLYERHGAIKMSMMADHGHNLMQSKNVPVSQWLTSAGLHPSDSLRRDDDVVLEVNGLVTYAGVQTTQPTRVADALLSHPQVELAIYMQGDRVIVRDATHFAAIDCRDGRVGYTPIDGDVLGYVPLHTGFATDEDWLSNTADDHWPDLPRRIWDAFHRTAVVPPRVMFTLKDGYCAGLKQFESFIDMASTHGGLNQINSATFVMTMCADRPLGPMRSRDVLNWLQSGFEPVVHTK